MRKELREKYIKEVYGTNKERDYSILELVVLQPNLTYNEIIKALGLDISQARISEILTENQVLKFKLFVSLNPLYLKEGRTFEIVATYLRKKNNGEISKKDGMDLIEQLRREIEGNQPLVKVEQHTHFTTIKEVIESAANRRREYLTSKGTVEE